MAPRVRSFRYPLPALFPSVFVLTLLSMGVGGCSTEKPKPPPGPAPRPAATSRLTPGPDGATATGPDDAGSNRSRSAITPGDPRRSRRAPVAWADWPAPNSPGLGLPNAQDYDVSTAGVVVDKVTG
jgi:hypothetical protein